MAMKRPSLPWMQTIRTGSLDGDLSSPCHNGRYGNSNCFEVRVSMHQRSALNPLLSAIVTEALSREFKVALP